MTVRLRKRLRNLQKQMAMHNNAARTGVIDIGSNSVRLVIYECYGAAATPVFNEKILAGLGRSLKADGKLYAPGVTQSLKALARFALIAEAHGLETLRAVATAAMREASDGPDFIKAVKAQTGIKIDVLSGAEEARMSAYGVISGDHRARGTVADLGGASLELVHVENRRAAKGRTYPLGPFVMMENGFDAQALRPQVKDKLKGASDKFSAKGEALYLVGGAWRNLALIHNQRRSYPLQILQNFEMNTVEALSLARWAAGDAAQDLMSWPGLSRRRAETLPYSGVVLEALITQLKPDRIIVSPSGLREGLLYLSLPEAEMGEDPLFDACEHLAMGNAQGLNFGRPLYDWLAPAAAHFPRGFDEASEARLRRAACLLVGMGKGLHPDHRAALVFDDVLYAPLSGLTHKERCYLALMLYSSYTGGEATPNDAAMNYHLLGREKQAAIIYGTAMRLATVIGARSAETLKAFTLGCDKAVLDLNVAPDQTALLNRRGVMRLKRLADLLGMSAQSNWQEALSTDDDGDDEDS